MHVDMTGPFTLVEKLHFTLSSWWSPEYLWALSSLLRSIHFFFASREPFPLESLIQEFFNSFGISFPFSQLKQLKSESAQGDDKLEDTESSPSAQKNEYIRT